MATLVEVLDAAVNHHVAGRLDDAERLYRPVLAAEPALPDPLHLLGVVAAQRGDARRAAVLIARAVRLAPAAAAPFAHLGGALRSLGRLDEAVDALKRALVLDPSLGDAPANLGAVLHAAARYEEALPWLWRAHRLRPDHQETVVNLGTVLRDLRRFADAEACFRHALAHRPGDAGAHLALAVSRLVQGDLPGGWEAFEWRWRRFPGQPWSGEPLAGRTLLLHAEQGFGDTIQFARYAPLAAERGGRVLLEVPRPLVRLLKQSLPEAVRVIPKTDSPPHHDLHCPLMSLPRAFGTALDSIPAALPYLRADPEDAAAWRERLAGPPGLRVGLVWAGNPNHRNDRNRSLPPDRLAPLAAVPGLRLIGLQTGDARNALPSPLRDRVEDVMDAVRDFADTAALLANLDLVIAVDTAIVHLAGALGRPAWVLLPYAPDWRWLLGRADTPWYPSLRLFRQPRPGDWSAVAGTVAALLRAVKRPESGAPAPP